MGARGLRKDTLVSGRAMGLAPRRTTHRFQPDDCPSSRRRAPCWSPAGNARGWTGFAGMALGLDGVLRRARGAGFSVSPAGFAGELLCVGAVLMRVSLAMGEQPVRPAGSARGDQQRPYRRRMDRLPRPPRGRFPDLQRENAAKLRAKKRHARVKKATFRLETRFFSSSIRSASGNADSHW